MFWPEQESVSVAPASKVLDQGSLTVRHTCRVAVGCGHDVYVYMGTVSAIGKLAVLVIKVTGFFYTNYHTCIYLGEDYMKNLKKAILDGLYTPTSTVQV